MVSLQQPVKVSHEFGYKRGTLIKEDLCKRRPNPGWPGCTNDSRQILEKALPDPCQPIQMRCQWWSRGPEGPALASSFLAALALLDEVFGLCYNLSPVEMVTDLQCVSGPQVAPKWMGVCQVHYDVNLQTRDNQEVVGWQRLYRRPLFTLKKGLPFYLLQMAPAVL